jgi:hypothetical protein
VHDHQPWGKKKGSDQSTLAASTQNISFLEISKNDFLKGIFFEGK